MQATGITPQLAGYDVALVHTTFSGEKEYVLLTMRRGGYKGDRASVESLVDKRCYILTVPPADSPIPIFLSRAAAARLR